MMTATQTMRTMQHDGILDALHEPGRPPMYTREIADKTPWGALTVIRRLHELQEMGLVERFDYGRWRLA